MPVGNPQILLTLTQLYATGEMPSQVPKTIVRKLVMAGYVKVDAHNKGVHITARGIDSVINAMKQVPT